MPFASFRALADIRVAPRILNRSCSVARPSDDRLKNLPQLSSITTTAFLQFAITTLVTMNPEENFTAFQDGIFTSVMTSVQTSGRIAAEDVPFQRSSNPDFNTALDETSTRILTLVGRLLKSASRGSDLAAPKMQDTDDIDTKWGDVVEIVDFMLEKAVCPSFSLDEADESAHGLYDIGYLSG